MEETIASPLLVDKTPDSGLTLTVWEGEGGLSGLRLLEQQDGPPVIVELSIDGGEGWGGVPYPYVLAAGDLLRLTRTDDSPELSVVHATVPAPAGATGGGVGGGTTTTTALFTARLRDSGPGLPTGAVTVAVGTPERPVPVLGSSIMQAGGRTWLSLQVAAALAGSEQLKVRFATAYTLTTGAVSSNPSNMSIESELPNGNPLTGAVPSLMVISGGPRNVAGMIAPDAFPFTNYPSASLPNGGLELVAGEGSPYLRTVIDGQEYRVALTPHTP